MKSTSTSRRVALIGHPNTGKSTLFNALTDGKAHIANYPGVTVAAQRASLSRCADGSVTVIDLPGTYSLTARSLDEAVAIDALSGAYESEEKPDLVLVILDSENLERGLFLGTQVLDLGLPTAFVVNKIDLAEAGGIRINSEELSARLSVPVLMISAAKEKGLDELRSLILSKMEQPAAKPFVRFPDSVEEEIQRLSETVGDVGRGLLLRALLDQGGQLEERFIRENGEPFRTALFDARNRLAESGHRLGSLEAKVRYGVIRTLLADTVEEPGAELSNVTDRIDNILLNKFFGTALFIFIMLVMFQAIYAWAGPLMDGIEGLFGMLADGVSASLPPGPLQSLITDGVIGGIGGVLVFLPQILILFLFLGLLEQCGYMARVAFLMDKVLSRVGLSGRSFIPMLSSFACAIPGVMATRTIENRNDRMTTMLVAPLMSCSARLPVYLILISAFVPEKDVIPGLLGLQATMLFAMHFVGLIVAIPVALLLKKTLFRGSTPPLIMELPSYRVPNVKLVLRRVAEKGWDFLRGAGTIILSATILIWALSYFPRPDDLETEISAVYTTQIENVDAAMNEFHVGINAFYIPGENDTIIPNQVFFFTDEESEKIYALYKRREELVRNQENAIASAYLEQSYLGRMGHAVEPIVRPLGWDWRIAVGAIASFPAREVIIATMGVLFQVGSDVDEESTSLRDSLKQAVRSDGTPLFTLPVALSIMVFFALCAQCAATLAVIAKESGSWKWPVFTFVYMTVLAYVGALLVYQISAAVFL